MREDKTREERFKMNMIDEFKQMCEIVEKDGRIIVNKQSMLKALKQEQKTDILDKIQAEIEKASITDLVPLSIVIAIIDKHKA